MPKVHDWPSTLGLNNGSIVLVLLTTFDNS
jgi:hypothetical protein